MKYAEINLEPIAHGVILAIVEEEELVVNTSNISVKNSFEEKEMVWKGKVEVVKVGPLVTEVEPGDTCYMNIATKNKIVFEHKGYRLLWSVPAAILAKIKPESKIIL